MEPGAAPRCVMGLGGGVMGQPVQVEDLRDCGGGIRERGAAVVQLGHEVSIELSES